MKRGLSTTKPTKAEAARIIAAKDGPCMACLAYANTGLMESDFVIYGCDYNHAKSGNVRRGHMEGYALCIWHHRRVYDHSAANCREMREVFGPSLMDGSRLFHETYGSDDELIAAQTNWIEQNAQVSLWKK